jgi:hypothetical protein
VLDVGKLVWNWIEKRILNLGWEGIPISIRLFGYVWNFLLEPAGDQFWFLVRYTNHGIVPPIRERRFHVISSTEYILQSTARNAQSCELAFWKATNTGQRLLLWAEWMQPITGWVKFCLRTWWLMSGQLLH